MCIYGLEFCIYGVSYALFAILCAIIGSVAVASLVVYCEKRKQKGK